MSDESTTPTTEASAENEDPDGSTERYPEDLELDESETGSADDSEPTEVSSDSDTTSGSGESGGTDDTARESAPKTDGPLPETSGVTDILYWGAFGVLLVLALFATMQAYTSASHAIDVWIARDYQPLFEAAFNLGVLLACGIGLSVLVRRRD